MVAIVGGKAIPDTSPEFTGVVLIDGKKILDLGRTSASLKARKSLRRTARWLRPGIKESGPIARAANTGRNRLRWY